MTPPIFLVLPVAVLCGVLGLDRRCVAQVMVSGALVAGAAAGWLSGDVWLGLKVGAVSALLWSNVQPVGGVIPPNDTVVACVATVLAAQWARMGMLPDAAGALALLCAIPAGMLAVSLDRLQRRWNGLWFQRHGAESFGELATGLRQVQLSALMLTFLNDFTVCLVAGVVGLHVVGELLPLPGPTGERALIWVSYLLPLIGVATAIQSINRRRVWGILAATVALYYVLEPALPPLLVDPG